MLPSVESTIARIFQPMSQERRDGAGSGVMLREDVVDLGSDGFRVKGAGDVHVRDVLRYHAGQHSEIIGEIVVSV